MKTLITIMILVVIAASSALGGNVDYLNNRSANYFRNFARAAATDAPDIISYNPAGVSSLGEGFHISFGNQFIMKEFVVEATAPFWDTTTAVEYTDTEPTLFLPDFYAVYRTGDLGVFGAFTIPAGGGGYNYEDGLYSMSLIETRVQQQLQAMAGNPYAGYASATMSDGYIKASAMYLGGTLGMSYKINDMFSVALAGRYVSAAKAYEGQGDFTTAVYDTSGTPQYGTVSRVLDVEKKASGFNGIVGIDIAPMENLNIGLRYETATELEFETTVTQNDWAMFFAPDSSFTNGYMERRDLPAVFSGGISYAFTPELTVSAMYNRFFVTTEKDDNAGIDSMYVDGSDIAFGIDYLVSPGILLSVGYLHSDNGGCDVVYEDDDGVPNLGTYSEFEYSLNSDAIGGGVKYSINENMAFTLAGGHNFYKEGLGVYPDLSVSEGIFNKSATYFALGAEMSF